MSTQGAFLFNKREREDSPPLPSSSSSSSSKSRWKYEVFLSFRGKDTRKSFADHLFHALKEKGIFTFRDDERLERGTTISEELLKAIEKSRFAIVIFSENYASSRWCLDELVHIVKCKNEKGLKVVPVFYHVNPSEVRHQVGTFAQAFDKHKERFKESIEKMETWRAALREAADLSGWDLQDRHESEFIQQIVEDIMEKLTPEFSSFTKNLVGIDFIMKKLIPLRLGFRNRVYMLGICGMGGLGKTTLARAIYYRFSKFFEGSSFIHNIRERSKPSLLEIQQQLLGNLLESHEKIWDFYEGVDIIKRRLCHKKVLLVLDDVDHVDQLEKLAGGHDWFGLGSWIIITTRDEHVLIDHGVLETYKPNGLDDVDASKLFCLKAFKKEQPKKSYMQLSQNVVEYASGLPLALVTLGSFLVGRTVEEWQSALDSFKNIKGNIHGTLKISYDGLEEMWKEIFLDIACFFREHDKDEVIQILENCGFNARIGVSVLVERSLLTVGYNKCFGMHDLLSEMGQKIIRFESGGKLGMQSRLWLVEDLRHVLENDMATEAIQAIVVCYKKNDLDLEKVPEMLSSKMSNLRLMIIKKTGYYLSKKKKTGYWNDLGDPAVPNNQRQLFVPNQLRHLRWDFCPLKCLSSSSQPKELVQLDLKYSRIEYLWEGVMRSVNLKFINLCHSKNLIRTPDFSGVPKLERLDLSACRSLVEIHPSIGQLSKLKYLNLFLCDSLVEIHPSIGQLSELSFLNLERCKSLTDLPCMSAVMQSLAELNLINCRKISSLPKFTGIMKSLSTLNLARTAIKKVEPSSIECLPALTFLNLQGTNLKALPRLPSTVRCINVIHCNSLKWLPARVKLSIWSRFISQWLPYDERHNRKEFTILFHFLQVQGLLCRKTVYGTSSKGKEDGSITEFLIIMLSWLIKIVENSISIELPSNWFNSKWIGLALWASVSDRSSEFGIAIGKMPQNHCAFELFTTRINVEVKTETHNNYLLYLSRDEWFAIVGNDECSQIKVIFEGSKLYYTEIGVSLVYEKDVDEFNQTNAQCLFESFGKVRICKLIVGDDDGDDNEKDVDEFNQTNAQCLFESFGKVHICKLIVGGDDDDDDDDDENDDEDDDGDADEDDDEDGDEDDDGDDDEDGDEDGDWDGDWGVDEDDDWDGDRDVDEDEDDDEDGDWDDDWDDDEDGDGDGDGDDDWDVDEDDDEDELY